MCCYGWRLRPSCSDATSPSAGLQQLCSLALGQDLGGTEGGIRRQYATWHVYNFFPTIFSLLFSLCLVFVASCTLDLLLLASSRPRVFFFLFVLKGGREKYKREEQENKRAVIRRQIGMEVRSNRSALLLRV